MCITRGLSHGRHWISDHWPSKCLFTSSANIKEASTYALLALYECKPPVVGGFSSQMASYVESASMSWCHHIFLGCSIYTQQAKTLYKIRCDIRATFPDCVTIYAHGLCASIWFIIVYAGQGVCVTLIKKIKTPFINTTCTVERSRWQQLHHKSQLTGLK